jgi:serine O-acetyltransferase
VSPLTGDREFESISLQRRVACEPDFLDQRILDDLAVEHASDASDDRLYQSCAAFHQVMPEVSGHFWKPGSHDDMNSKRGSRYSGSPCGFLLCKPWLPAAALPTSYRPARCGSLALEDDQGMTEINVVAQEIAASRQRGKPADEGKLWETMRLDAERAAAGEEMLRSFLDLLVLRHDGFASGLGLLIARKLAEYSMPAEQLGESARAAMAGDPGIITAAIADLVAIRTRDPAAENYLSPFLYYKGFHALQCHRIGHWLWHDGRRELAHFLQSRVSQVLAIDIHPAVPIGRGVFIDHGTGLVVGETAVIGDDVSILHEVTLGGTGKERGDRHPKVRDGVLLCAGAKVLGNVEIGRDAKVGAGSVVLQDVPPGATVAGVPARIVGWSGGSVPALEMDQSLPDYEI